MYKVKPVFADEEIIRFENMRYKAFGYNKVINRVEQSAYGKAIKDMDAYPFFCTDNDNVEIGGILITENKHKLLINYLFVDEKFRNKKAGSFLLEFIIENKEMFENLFFEDIHSIVANPLLDSTDFYYDNGFDSYRNVVYRKYK